jgi:hypothetical protein
MEGEKTMANILQGRPWVIIVGGFLGAGKTTLLLAAAEELRRRGMRPALILNDQGEDLVDTRYAGLHRFEAREVTGGCFCCRFSSLIQAMDALREQSPDVLLAEPVGSCTDIAATILQPLRAYADVYRVARFTVLVDPPMAVTMLLDDADDHLRFLFTKQLQEADLVCLTKSDVYPNATPLEGKNVRRISAMTGVGVAAWLDDMMSDAHGGGTRLLDIDYQQYAEAEGALAWLNLQAGIRVNSPISSAEFLRTFLNELGADLHANGIPIVHLKAIAQNEAGFAKAAICFDNQESQVEGVLGAAPRSNHELLLNLRAVGRAAAVQSIVQIRLDKTGSTPSGVRIACFHPAAPRPERHITQVP